jgi:hypothetical protein
MPNQKQERERLLLEKQLKLSQLTDLVSPRDLCLTAYKKAKVKWGRYFHSPVDKVAAAQHGVFRFDSYGAFRGADHVPDDGKETDTDFHKLLHELFPRPVARDEAVKDWLLTGEPLSREKVETIKRVLFPAPAKLTNESLFDLPICRLVHRSQLRRDLNYQVVYQLTPAQVRLIDRPHENSHAPTLEDLHRNQRLYWGISETFQSLVAMFDSDLGSRRKAKDTSMTKELIRLTREHHKLEVLAPDELNKSSPLRFWAPPPVFCDSVFHMLFWRSMITGVDLFGRDVITTKNPARSIGNTLTNRANQYYVLINLFNAAKFHLADYEKLFDALMAIARIVGKARRSRSKDLFKRPDILLVDDPKGLLYPSYFPHSKVKFPRFKRVKLTVPCKSLEKELWELTSDGAKQEPTTISDLLKFLRDKALETVIWSKYQMEIRSVGLIPVQHLYQLELTDKGIEMLRPLVQHFRKIDRKHLKPAETAGIKEAINQSMTKAIFNEDVDDWVSLKRVCGGTYRKVDDKAAWEKLTALKSQRSVSHGNEKRLDTNAKRKRS